MLEERFDYSKNKDGIEINGNVLNKQASDLGLEIVKVNNSYLVVPNGSIPNKNGRYIDCMFSSLSIFSIITYLRGYEKGKNKK